MIHLNVEELIKQSIAYGQVASYIAERRWWNPLRWTRGKYVRRIIGPKKFFIMPKRWWEFWRTR